MNVIQQMVKDEIDRRKDLVADADQRLLDAESQLVEAKANAERAHEELDLLKAWLQTSGE